MRADLVGIVARLRPAASTVSPPPTGTYQGCPSGAVCIYPQDAGWNNGHPSDSYYSYGPHNLVNQFGTHRIFNNQTGGANMRNCTRTGGTGCPGYLAAGRYMDQGPRPDQLDHAGAIERSTRLVRHEARRIGSVSGRAARLCAVRR